MAPDTEQFTPLPDHTQLPAEDGTFVKNFQKHPQRILLTESIRPVLDQVYGDRLSPNPETLGGATFGIKRSHLANPRGDRLKSDELETRIVSAPIPEN